jgi:hypothetical protein
MANVDMLNLRMIHLSCILHSPVRYCNVLNREPDEENIQPLTPCMPSVLIRYNI